MRRHASIWLYLAILMGVILTTVSAPHAENLIEALVDAYTTNPGLQAERARLRAIDERVPQALSNWRPTVTINGKLGLERADRTSAAGVKTVTNGEPRSADLTISQPLFRGFRTHAQTERARQQVVAQRARLVASEQDVLLDAVTAYMNVVRERALLELNISNVRVLERQLEATEDRFQVGELTRTDVAQAESRVQRAVANRVNAEGELTSAIAGYVNVIGHEPGDLEFPANLGGLPAAETDAVDAARVNNPDVISAEFDERAAQADILLVRGELLPTLTLNGSISRNDDGADRTEATTRSLTASLKVPLYQSGAVFSRLREAKQTASRRRSEVADSQRGAIEQATRAWDSLVTARARITAFEAEVRAQEIALDGVQQEARVGSRTVLDELDAEQELLDARVNLVRAERDEIVASHDLLSSVGRLTAEDLGLPVEYHNLTANYDRVRNRWIGAN